MKTFDVIDIKRGKACKVEAVDANAALIKVHLELYGYLATEKAQIVTTDTCVMIGKKTPALAVMFDREVEYA